MQKVTASPQIDETVVDWPKRQCHERHGARATRLHNAEVEPGDEAATVRRTSQIGGRDDPAKNKEAETTQTCNTAPTNSRTLLTS